MDKKRIKKILKDTDKFLAYVKEHCKGCGMYPCKGVIDVCDDMVVEFEHIFASESKGKLMKVVWVDKF